MDKVFIFKITGLTPILMSNPSSMDNQDDGTAKTPQKYPKEEEAKKRLYINDDGTLYLPAIAFRNSLWQGGAYMKLGKQTARNVIASSVFVIEEKVPLLDKDTEKFITEYAIDSRYVVVTSGTKKNRIMRHRPCVTNWMVKLPLQFDVDFVDPEQILPVFERAGKVIGVMDYRPACKGMFGRYAVEL
jgi:hypothetical protein